MYTVLCVNYVSIKLGKRFFKLKVTGDGGKICLENKGCTLEKGTGRDRQGLCGAKSLQGQMLQWGRNYRQEPGPRGCEPRERLISASEGQASGPWPERRREKQKPHSGEGVGRGFTLSVWRAANGNRRFQTLDPAAGGESAPTLQTHLVILLVL